MLKLRKVLALILTAALMTVLLSVSAMASEPEDTFSVDTFECVPLETDPAVLQLNQSAEITVSARSVDDKEANLARTEEAYDTLMRSFYAAQPAVQVCSDEANETYTVSGIAAEGFPHEYAGAYVNQDWNLVVLLTEDITQQAATLSEGQYNMMQAANSDGLIFASAKYSYNYLVSLMNDIYQYMNLPDSEKSTKFSIVYYLINDYDNCVTVGIDDIGTESIEAFKTTVSQSDAIKFELADTVEYKDTAQLYPGQSLNNGNGSLAFRCSKMENGKTVYGFVTAGHCYSPGAYVQVNGVNVAIATSSWQNSGSIDAVFCRLLTGHTVGTTIQTSTGSTLRSAIDVSLAKGNPLTMVGCKSGRTYGTVESSSYSFGSWTDMLEASYSCDFGDSGGIVISTRTGSNYVAGVHKGYITLINNHSIATKAINITQTLGLSMH